jgi:glycolate oxidase FAD binding subunit
VTERSILTARDAAEVAAHIMEARASGAGLEIRGLGSRTGLGHPTDTLAVLDVGQIAGIVDYDPSELVLTARPGTPLAEMEQLVAAEGQYLAFEPPHFRVSPLSGSLGGAVSCGWSGPRRVHSGRLRDHVLGVVGVTGWGETVRTGGKVIKNVTGYDMPKLMAGSMGTLMVMTELSIKVMPAPLHAATVVLHGLEASNAVRAMAAAMATPCAVSGAAHVTARRGAGAKTMLRLEGTELSVADRVERLCAALASHCRNIEVIAPEFSFPAWEAIRNGGELDTDDKSVIWRVTLPPSRASDFVGILTRLVGCHAVLDCGGSVVWLSLPRVDDAHETLVRGTLHEICGSAGSATLAHAEPEVRHRISVFQPLAPAVMALEERLRRTFDPDHVLNPGRMRRLT